MVKSCVSPLRSFSSYVYCFVGLLLFMIFCFSCCVKYHSRPLYDCSRVYHATLYKFIDHAQCQHQMHLSNSKVQYFIADVLQYSPRSSHLTIYHCTAEKLEMTCYKSFFGHKSKHRSLHTLSVSVHDCTSAMRTHVTRFGKLRRLKRLSQ